MLYCDNKTVWDIAQKPIQHDKTKYVEVDRFFINKKFEDNIVVVPHIFSLRLFSTEYFSN